MRSPVIGGDLVRLFFQMSFLSSLVRIFGHDDVWGRTRENRWTRNDLVVVIMILSFTKRPLASEAVAVTC